jgi:hypothetical protein
MAGFKHVIFMRACVCLQPYAGVKAAIKDGQEMRKNFACGADKFHFICATSFATAGQVG